DIDFGIYFEKINGTFILHDTIINGYGSVVYMKTLNPIIVIKRSRNTSINSISFNNIGGFIIEDSANIKLYNLVIFNSTYTGLSIINTINITINDVLIRYSKEAGLIVKNSTLYARNIRIKENAGAGIVLEEHTISILDKVAIYNNNGSGAIIKDSSIYLGNAHVLRNKGDGIKCIECRDLILVDSLIEDNYRNGLYISSKSRESYTNITNCIFRNNTMYQVIIYGINAGVYTYINKLHLYEGVKKKDIGLYLKTTNNTILIASNIYSRGFNTSLNFSVGKGSILTLLDLKLLDYRDTGLYIANADRVFIERAYVHSSGSRHGIALFSINSIRIYSSTISGNRILSNKTYSGAAVYGAGVNNISIKWCNFTDNYYGVQFISKKQYGSASLEHIIFDDNVIDISMEKFILYARSISMPNTYPIKVRGNNTFSLKILGYIPETPMDKIFVGVAVKIYIKRGSVEVDASSLKNKLNVTEKYFGITDISWYKYDIINHTWNRIVNTTDPLIIKTDINNGYGIYALLGAREEFNTSSSIYPEIASVILLLIAFLIVLTWKKTRIRIRAGKR
ncbi:MAG: right-handed parallel beta-helix repeat-containing protein, partial [Desulfurococcales archaeon]|nr:right-handed parallel beta-helix repeat-containing protein [Desulfurococcales archaeon]